MDAGLDPAAARDRRPALRVHRRALGRRPLPARRAQRLPGPRAAVTSCASRAAGPATRPQRRGGRARSASAPTACGAAAPPLRIGSDAVSAFRLSRLAVPLPPILPSLNQIGFDSYDMAVGALEVSGGREGSVLLWAMSTKRGRAAGSWPTARGRSPSRSRAATATTRCCSPSAASASPSRSATCRMRRFDLRMQLGADRRARGASLYAEVFCPEVPVYGPALIAIGLCNRDLKLPAGGTFITRPYRGPANRRPRGLQRRRASSSGARRPERPARSRQCSAGACSRARPPLRRHPAHRRRQRATWWRSTTARPPRSASATETSAIVRLSAARGQPSCPARMRVLRDRRCLPACRTRTAVSIPLHSPGSDLFHLCPGMCRA